jgi:hypothetical protein
MSLFMRLLTAPNSPHSLIAPNPRLEMQRLKKWGCIDFLA